MTGISDSKPDRGGCDAPGCEVCALATELAEERTLTGRLHAENERLRKQLRREQIIASALAKISHVIDEKQSGADVIHTEDCPACAASQRIADALALSSDEQGASDA
jgi:hypothetical protein